MPTDTVDPYSPPQANLERSTDDVPQTSGAAPNAERMARLAAAFIDGLVMLPAIVVAVLAVASGDEMSPLLGIVAFLCALLTIAIAVRQLLGFLKTGQTIGKAQMKIAVVRLDGRPVTFGTACARTLVVAALGAIPFIGSFISLADTLMIFSDDRRCLHDRIAGTRVIALR